MTKLIARIEIENENSQNIKVLAGLIQDAVRIVDHQDLIKLLTKVKSKPELIKTALTFV